MPAPAAEKREERRDPDIDSPGKSVNGLFASLLSFQFNVPDAELPANPGNLPMPDFEMDRRVGEIDRPLLKRRSLGVSVVIGDSR